MRNRKFRFIPCLLLLLALLVSACTPASPETTTEILSSPPSPTPTAVPQRPTSSPIPPTETTEPTATLTPEPTPAPLLYPDVQGDPSMAYDAESGKLVLLPGYGNDYGSLLARTWVFDLATNTWQQLERNSPSVPRGEGPMAYDSQSDRTIKFLGAPFTNSSFFQEDKRETWAYDTNTNQWANMNPAKGPVGLTGARMVYDSESDRIILYGGYALGNSSQTSDIWAYDFEANTWTNMQPSGEPPLGENYYAMSYDAGADRVIVWRCRPGIPGDTVGIYDYNSNTWEKRVTEVYPTHCESNAMVYEPKTGLNILFGGVNTSDEDEPTNETWGYDYATNTWTNLSAKNPPSARGWHAMVYNEQAGVIMLFGGGFSQEELTNEMWLFEPVGAEWTNVSSNP